MQISNIKQSFVVSLLIIDLHTNTAVYTLFHFLELCVVFTSHSGIWNALLFNEAQDRDIMQKKIYGEQN